MSLDHYRNRIQHVSNSLKDKSIEAMLVTPGSDLSYLTGYHAVPLERLTVLVLARGHDPFMIVPLLEKSTAEASPFGKTGWDIIAWGENDDPYSLITSRIGEPHGLLALDNHMWAERVLILQERFPDAKCVTATHILNEIRVRKTPHELESLREAAAAIDRVHAKVPSVLQVGRTEREVGKDIGELIIAEGHQRIDFIIVASGPNGASPHHELSDRVIQPGDAVVVDIGGTMPSGYCSDCTRTYSMGQPDPEFLSRYQVLQRAQEMSTRAVHDGAVSHDIDAAGRGELDKFGLGKYFIHRTGHGIGLDTHEEPYIGIENQTIIKNGMVFSIEPGFYVEGVHGARIEDIVICTPLGPETLNKQPRDLTIIPA